MIPQSMKNQISKDVIINGKSLHKELFGMMTYLAKLAFRTVYSTLAWRIIRLLVCICENRLQKMQAGIY